MQGITCKYDTKITLRKLTLFSIWLYILCATSMEYNSSLSYLASYSLYLCIGCCLIFNIASMKIQVFYVWILLCIFGIIIYISSFYTPASSNIVNQYLYRYWTSIVIILFALPVFLDFKDIYMILNAYILGGMLLSIFVYSEYGLPNLALTGERLGNSDEFGNVNTMSMNCSITVVLSVYKIIVQKNKSRFLFILPIIITMPLLIFSGSRKALLIVFITILSLALLTTGRNKKFRSFIWIVIIFLISWYMLNNLASLAFLQERFEGLFAVITGNKGNVAGDENRVQFIEVGIKHFLKSPILGNGFYYSNYLFGTYTHNNYIELLLNNGIIGFVAYYSIYLYLFLISNKLNPSNRKAFILIRLILIVYLVAGIGVVTYYDRLHLLLFAILSITGVITKNYGGDIDHVRHV